MKKIFLILPILALAACDSFDAPKCWDDTVKKNLLETTYTVQNNTEQKFTYKAKQVSDIVELFNKEAHENHARFCNAKILYMDGITRLFKYAVSWGIKENSKEPMILNLGEL